MTASEAVSEGAPSVKAAVPRTSSALRVPFLWRSHRFMSCRSTFTLMRSRSEWASLCSCFQAVGFSSQGATGRSIPVQRSGSLSHGGTRLWDFVGTAGRDEGSCEAWA